jgi:hypothetical protein
MDMMKLVCVCMRVCAFSVNDITFTVSFKHIVF